MRNSKKNTQLAVRNEQLEVVLVFPEGSGRRPVGCGRPETSASGSSPCADAEAAHTPAWRRGIWFPDTCHAYCSPPAYFLLLLGRPQPSLNQPRVSRKRQASPTPTAWLSKALRTGKDQP